jgi:hypothetical protein
MQIINWLGDFRGAFSRLGKPTIRKSHSRSRRHLRRDAVEVLESRLLLTAQVGVDPVIGSGDAWKSLDTLPQEDPGHVSYLRTNDFAAYQLNFSELASVLDQAPMEFSNSTPIEVLIPNPDGSFSRFAMVDSPIMAPELAAQFPDIKTFAGQGLDDLAATIRIDISPAGFHAQVLSPSGSYYVDPYFHLDPNYYASYYASTMNATGVNFQEPLEELANADLNPETNPTAGRDPNGDGTGGGTTTGPITTAERSGTQLRTYRLAVAATGEYVAFQGGTVALGQAAIVTAVNRVSGIYETELSVRLQLIANNSSLVYTNANTDPYTNDDPGALLDENQTNIDSVIGSANYDIGHVFTTGGGGLAGLGVVGQDGVKAEGETGLDEPIGDAFYVDYVAHEMGHQFGGNHTFNGFNGSAFGNDNPGTAYEPGSGTTIMAYAGICGVDDLQPHSDPYFHSASFDEIIKYVDTVIPNVGTRTATGNTVPTVNAGLDYKIPARTPFELTAVGSDGNASDVLTYSWEERDLGPLQQVDTGDNGSSPILRDFSPTTDPSRTFPRLSDLLNNTTVVGEKLPTTSRTMKFRVTVRDNESGGGGVNTDDMQVTVINTGAAFAVTSPNTNVSWVALTPQTVTWNVAGTTGNGINAANVNILLSTDGGKTFPTVLASNVPNDGSEIVSLPNSPSTQARIKVEAAGNIFFDISDTNFTITPNPNTFTSVVRLNDGAEKSTPTNGTFRINFTRALLSPTVVNYSITGGATAGSDYVTLPGSVTAPAGATFVDIDVQVQDDNIVEANEPVTMTLTGFGQHDSTTFLSAVAADLTATLSITDNDTAKVSIVKLADGAEGTPSSNGSFQIALSALSSTATVVNYSIGGTATPGSSNDFATLSGSVTIPANSLTANITVLVANDTVVESTESVVLTLSSLGTHDPQITIDTTPFNVSATVNITDDDRATVSIAKLVDGAESNSSTSGQFRVTQSAPSNTNTVVNYSVGGSASSGANGDYSALSGTVTIPAGMTTVDVSIPVKDDLVVEGTENILLTLTGFGAHDAKITLDPDPADLQAVVSIIDNDVATFTVANASASEGAGSLSFIITISRPFDIDVIVDASFSGGTASGGGVDYDSTTRQILFPAGSTSQSLSVPVVADDVVEATESFNLALSSATPLGTRKVDFKDTATGTILDDDSAIILINNASALEGAGNLVFDLVSDKVLGVAVTVEVSFVRGTAIGGGTDFVSTTQQIVFNPGQSIVQVSVPLNDDGIVEGSEDFTAQLRMISVPSGLTITANDTAQGLIIDNDQATVSVVKLSDGSESDTPTNGKFQISLSSVSSTDTIVTYSVGGTATPGVGNDYSALSGTATILAGRSSVGIDVRVFGDQVVEPSESVILSLSGLGNHDPDITLNTTPENRTATVLITDDDTSVLKISSPTRTESAVGIVTLSFLVTSPKIVSGGFTVGFDVANVTAKLGSDYSVVTSSPLTFAGTENEQQTIIILVHDDAIVEGDETLSVTLGVVTPADPTVIGRIATGAVGTGTIVDNDTATFSVSDVTVNEADNSLVFNLVTDHVLDVDLPLTVNYSDVTARGGFDFNGAPSQITFKAGDTSKSVSVPIINDNLVEATETFLATLSTVAALNGHHVDFTDKGVGQIKDDDTATFTVGDVTVDEAAGTASFDISVDRVLDTDVTLAVSFSNGTATGGDVDFTSSTIQVVLPAGSKSLKVAVQIKDDSIVEDSETFTAGLSTISDLADRHVNFTDKGTATILDNDSATVSLTKISDGAESAVPTNGLFRVTQSAVSSTDTVVTYSIGGTATPGAGKDYAALTGTVTIPAGKTSADINVTVFDDNLVESDETVIVTLTGFSSGDANIGLAGNQSALTNTVSILDDDLVFLTIPGSVSVAENTLASTVILDAQTGSALAPGHALTFSLSGPDAALFSIDSATGEIRFKSSPDYDVPADQGKNHVYDVTVTVAADVTPARQASQAVSIVLTDLNDNPPVFFDSSPTYTIPENLAVGMAVGQDIATDADLPPQTVTYSIVAGNLEGAFAVNSATGEITVADSTPLNFEHQKTFTLTIRATDSGLPTRTADAVVVVNVTDVFEGPIITLPTQSLTFQPGKSPIVMTPDAEFKYEEDPNPSFAGSTLIASIVAGRPTGDVLGLFKNGDPTGQIVVKGKKVYSNGTLIGTFEGGKGNHPSLLVKLNASAKSTDVEALMRRLSFSSNNTVPNTRVVQLQIVHMGNLDSNKAQCQITNG